MPLFLYEKMRTGIYCFQEVVTMVKGVSRQVIVVHSPDPKLFDQAIFILKDGALGAEGVTEEHLLQEAKRLIGKPRKRKLSAYGPVWACGGAVATGLLWLLSTVL